MLALVHWKHGDAAAQLAAVVRLLYGWGYGYVENLTWVQMAPNNTVLTAPAPYAQRSHLTLLIFRRTGAEAAGATLRPPLWTQGQPEHQLTPAQLQADPSSGAVLRAVPSLHTFSGRPCRAAPPISDLLQGSGTLIPYICSARDCEQHQGIWDVVGVIS